MSTASGSASVFDHPAINGLDRAGERMAEGARGRSGPDRALYLLSEAANHSLLWHGINLLDAVAGSAAVAVAARRTGRNALRAAARHARRAVRRSAVLAVEQAFVNVVVKSVFRRRRPDHIDEHPHELRTPRTSSFPSGHASAGACAAVLLGRDLGVPALWWGLAAAIGWSRVHVGAHHTSDVLGGAALGATLAVLAGRLWPPAG